MDDFLKRVYFGNTIFDYLTAAGILLLVIIITGLFRRTILRKLKEWSKNTETKIDDFIVRGTERTIIPLLYLGALYLALHSLTIIPSALKVIDTAMLIIFTFFLTRTIISIFKFILNSYLIKKGVKADREKEIRGILALVSFVIWSLSIIFLLDNLGFKISAVIAGLGIGGIAIALAAQAVLGDLFSYFVIFFDRPFEIGDFIIVGDKMGAVEYIGVKTTRLRSLGGEQIIMSNTDLTSSRVNNYKRMERRRVVFTFGVTYQTPATKLKEIPPLVKKIIEDAGNTQFDRSHFLAYGSFSLNYENVYYVLSPDYNIYMDIQQKINLDLYEAFEKLGIGFAYPTQTLYMNKATDSGLKSEIV